MLQPGVRFASVRDALHRQWRTMVIPTSRSGSEAHRGPEMIKPRSAPLRILVIGTLRGANEVAARQQPVADVASKAANLFSTSERASEATND